MTVLLEFFLSLFCLFSSAYLLLVCNSFGAHVDESVFRSFGLWGCSVYGAQNIIITNRVCDCQKYAIYIFISAFRLVLCNLSCWRCVYDHMGRCQWVGVPKCTFRLSLYFGYNFVRAGFYDLQPNSHSRITQCRAILLGFLFSYQKKEMLVVHISLYAVVKFNFFSLFFPLILSRTAAHITETYVKCAFERGWKKSRARSNSWFNSSLPCFVLFSNEMAGVYGGMSMARKWLFHPLHVSSMPWIYIFHSM